MAFTLCPISNANALSQFVPILSLMVAVLAVFVGPLITLRIGKKQIELSRRIASKQVIAPMRQAWINSLREQVAELSGSAVHYWNTGFEQRNDAEFKRLTELEQLIILLINPGETDHMELLGAIAQMRAEASTRSKDAKKFFTAYNQTIALSQRILKIEWDRIKNDIERP